MSSVVQSPNALAVNYYNDFGKIFTFTEDGSLICTVESMKRVEDWFNRTYLLISLLTSVPLSDLHFQLDSDVHSHSTTVLNNHKLMLHHIYSVSYTALVGIASLIKQQIPPTYRSCPQIDCANTDVSSDNL